jgi:hypothetical protein
MSSYLRYIGSQINVIRSPRGTVQVFWQKDLVNMADVAGFIRVREAELRGIRLVGDPRAEIVLGMEMWHFPGWALLNGSDSYPDAPPARVPLAEVLNIIKVGLKPKLQAQQPA